MTREEVMNLARNCGSAYVNRHHPGITSFGFTEDCLMRFAELIAEAEREECAKVCADEATDAFAEGVEDWARSACMCAELIRARNA